MVESGILYYLLAFLYNFSGMSNIATLDTATYTHWAWGVHNDYT